MNEHDVAYVAGLFDGEGSISISHAPQHKTGKRYHRLQLSLTSTNRGVLLWLVERFGGYIGNHREAKDGYAKGNNKASARWQLASADAEQFLRMIQPYAIIKAPQIRVALEFRETRLVKGAPGTNPMTDELEAKREQLRMELQVLNRRGT